MVRSVRIVLALFLLLVSTLSFAGAVNINTADAQTISDGLKGVGPSKAQAIVAYRQEKGGFKAVEDLLNVKGIGPKTLELNREQLTLGEEVKKPAN
jgi:competence protein ComEA